VQTRADFAPELEPLRPALILHLSLNRLGCTDFALELVDIVIADAVDGQVWISI
jgi:hypothetical protein